MTSTATRDLDDAAERARLERVAHQVFAAFAAVCVACGAIAGVLSVDRPTSRWWAGLAVLLGAVLGFGFFCLRVRDRVPKVGAGSFLTYYAAPYLGAALVNPDRSPIWPIWVVVLLFAVLRRFAAFRQAAQLRSLPEL